ncbi:MAG TPA: rhodanese-like domain-containing protein [Elusimicrobiales bacterium]|nr:rhodanese-like domain-containing protein [Elusimicrobiales bacterium]
MTIDPETLRTYLPPAGIAAYFLYRYFRNRAVRKSLPGLAANGAVFVDVRTPGEFAAGNRPGSLNIPLDELAGRARELDKTRAVVLCCASGTRSGIAAGILRGLGFRNVTNAGPWQNTL